MDGREFFANGQVDANGEILVYAVFEYHRVAANGREALDHLTAKVRRRSRFFQCFLANKKRGSNTHWQ